MPSGVTISSLSVSFILIPASSIASAARPREQLSARSRLLDFLDPALHIEVPFRHVVVRAVENLFEAADGVGDRHLATLAAGEHLGRAERLAQEALDLS